MHGQVKDTGKQRKASVSVDKRLMPPPFYANLADNQHCLQASAKMAMEYFQKGFIRSFDYYDDLTGKDPNHKYTWPLRLTLELARKGYDIVFMDILDLRKLAEDPHATMVEAYGQSVADDQVAHSNMKEVTRDAFALTKNKNVKFKFQIPDYGDIIKLLTKGYLVICNVNARTLDEREGYSGHFVVVYDYLRDPDRLLIHNPGLPPRASQETSRELFEKAWAYTGEKYKNILALKK